MSKCCANVRKTLHFAIITMYTCNCMGYQWALRDMLLHPGLLFVAMTADSEVSAVAVCVVLSQPLLREEDTAEGYVAGCVLSMAGVRVRAASICNFALQMTTGSPGCGPGTHCPCQASPVFWRSLGFPASVSTVVETHPGPSHTPKA